MSGRLFAYGTLQFPAIFSAVSGLELRGVAATLSGYRCEGVRDEAYPAIMADRSETVTGSLYYGLPPQALTALDRFEGDEYRRRVVTVITDDGRARKAWCYVIAPRWRRRLDGRLWDPEQFARLQLAAYLRRLRRGP